jgi:hypothetical protein
MSTGTTIHWTQIDAELAARDARIAELEAELAMVLQMTDEEVVDSDIDLDSPAVTAAMARFHQLESANPHIRELEAALEKTIDAQPDAWMARALDAERERDAALKRMDELEKGPGVRFSRTPGGDDGDIVCAHCGLIVEDDEHGHSWEVCARGLFEDRNRSVDAMCDDFAKAMTRTEELEARVKELTEWRPISEAPKDGRVLNVLTKDCGVQCLARLAGDRGWTGAFTESDLLGWLPLPEAQ